MNGEHLTIFHVLKKKDNKPLLFDDSLKQFVEFRYVRVVADYYKPKDQHFDKTSWVGARNCREDDFSSPESGKRILSDWKGFTLICPDRR